MPSTQAVWGIDVGRCALKAVKLRTTADGKVEIVAQDYVEHSTILSQPEADRHELISAALEQFLSRNDISKDQVVVSVPGQHTLARFCKLPPVAPKKVPDIVRYEADQQIPFDMDEVIWDYQTFHEEGTPDIEVGIFAMKRELIREHLLHFEQASIEPIGVQSGPLAIYNAAHYDGLLSNETTIVLDIGAECTDLVIATPHRLWTRTVPIGGNHFTEALVKAFKLSFAKAEALKRTAQQSKYARQVFQAMRPVFADIVQELQRSLGFYSSTHRDAKVEKIVGVGNAFLLPGLQKYLQQNLNLPVEVPEGFKNATRVEFPNAAAMKEQHLSFYVAYGLALQGLDLSKVSSNLLPTEIAKQVVWRKKRPAFAAAVACLVVAGGIIWFRKTVDMRALAAGEEGATPSKMTLPVAAGVIEGGSLNLPDRAKAATVLAAGNTINQTLKGLSGKGEKERKQAEDLVTAQNNRFLVPKLVNVVHESLPQPDPAFATVKTAADAIEAAAKVPRASRPQIFIHTLNMDYVSELNNPPWPEKPLIEPEPSINDFSSGKEVAGILMKIVCVTPNQGGAKFVDDTFIKELRKNGRKDGLGFYFDRIWLAKGDRVEIKGIVPGSAGRPGGTGGRGGAARPGPAKPAAAVMAANPNSLDPVTNEPIENDWQFEIWVDVLLGDFSEAQQQAESPAPKGKKGTEKPKAGVSKPPKKPGG